MATSLQRSSIQHTDTSSDDNNHKVEQRHWKVLGANTLLFLPLQTCILGSSSVSTMHTKFPFLTQLVHVADPLKHPDQLPNIFRLQIAIMGNGPTLFRFYRYCSECLLETPKKLSDLFCIFSDKNQPIGLSGENSITSRLHCNYYHNEKETYSSNWSYLKFTRNVKYSLSLTRTQLFQPS